MGLFSKKENNFLGIDIGSASVKIVELENDRGQPRLVNYGFAEKLHRIESSRTEDIINQSAEIIKKVYEQTGFSTKNVVAALHNFDVFTSVLSLSVSDPKELQTIIKMEARKFVPIPLEDVVLDWKILRNTTNGDARHGLLKKGDHHDEKKKEGEEQIMFEDQQKGMEVLLTAAPRKLVKKYVDIFKVAGLNLLSLETESFAFIRALLDPHSMDSVMLVDMGAVATDIIIIEQQVPVIIKTVDVGGASITRAIERNLAIKSERAEQFKRDIGLTAPNEGQESSVIMQIIESTFAPIINEINYSLDMYKSKNQTISKMVLSGGSAYLAGIDIFLKNAFNLPVYIGDPWHRIQYPQQMRGVLQEIGPMFTVAIGLALKEIVEK